MCSDKAAVLERATRVGLQVSSCSWRDVSGTAGESCRGPTKTTPKGSTDIGTSTAVSLLDGSLFVVTLTTKPVRTLLDVCS